VSISKGCLSNFQILVRGWHDPHGPSQVVRPVRFLTLFSLKYTHLSVTKPIIGFATVTSRFRGSLASTSKAALLVSLAQARLVLLSGESSLAASRVVLSPMMLGRMRQPQLRLVSRMLRRSRTCSSSRRSFRCMLRCSSRPSTSSTSKLWTR